MKQLTDSDKKNIYNMLATAYIDLIKQGRIGKFERRIMSAKILENIEKAQTYQDVSLFTKDLLKIYPIFQYASLRIDSEIEGMHEADVMSRLKTFIKKS